MDRRDWLFLVVTGLLTLMSFSNWGPIPADPQGQIPVAAQVLDTELAPPLGELAQR